MKRIETETACPCGHANKVETKLPSHFRDSVCRYTCGECKSRIMVIFSVIKGNKGQVKNDVHILEPSKRLNEILADRKREWLEQINSAPAARNPSDSECATTRQPDETVSLPS